MNPEETKNEEVKTDPKINFADFEKVDIRVGTIVSAEKIPETDKLVKLMVDFAEAAPRQIISGIAMYFPDPAVLVGKQTTFVVNLEPRKIKGYESNGMLFALGEGETFSLLVPENKVTNGVSTR